MTHVVVRFARNAGIVALFVVAAMAGTLSGVLFAYAGDLPQISALDDYTPSTITRVYAADGQVIGEFATQRRVIVGYDDINPLLRQAIIATEDADFDRHFGINVWRIGRRRDDRHHRAAARPGRQHADAAARAQPQGAVRADVEKRGDFQIPRAEDRKR